MLNVTALAVLLESICTYSVFISRYLPSLELRLGFATGMLSFKFTEVFKECVTSLFARCIRRLKVY